ncbi:MAG: hypothetical protein SGJ02_00970 [bacterium]|nr:hypothetical protein [bacterium]
MAETKTPMKYNQILFILGIIAAISVGAIVPEIRCRISWDSKVCGVTQKEVELTTQTSIGESLAGVKIHVIAQGAPEVQYTDSNGYAKVRISSKGDVRVNLSKSGYPSQNFNINLENDPSIVRTIRFDPSGQPEVQSVPSLPLPTSSVSSNPSTPTPPPAPSINNDLLTKSVKGNLISQNEKERYYFTLGNPSNISLYLDEVENEALITLYTDNGNGLPGNEITEATATLYRPVEIEKILGSGKYIVEIKRRIEDTKYRITGTNYTKKINDFGSLGNDKKTDPSALNKDKRKQYYRFTIGNPGGVSLYLDQVQNETQITLYTDNGNGLPGNEITEATATRSQPGKIERNLASGNYIVLLSKRGGDTPYSFSIKLSSQPQ